VIGAGPLRFAPRFVLPGALALLLGGAPARADLFILQAVRSEPLEAFGYAWPASEDTLAIWVGADRVAVHGTGFAALFDFDAGRCRLLDAEARTYSELPLPFDLADLLPGDDPLSATLRRLAGLYHPAARVAPSAATRRIGPWTARLHRVEITSPLITMRAETWTTEDAGVDLGPYAAARRALLAASRATAEAAGELALLPGIPILEEQHIQGLGAEARTRRETLEIREAAPPPEAYGTPDGYSLQPLDPLRSLRR